jgi:hypothetical protein
VLIGETLHRFGDQLGFVLFEPALFQRRHGVRQSFGQGQGEAESAVCGSVGDVEQGGDVEVGELVAVGLVGVGGQLFQLDGLEVTDHRLRERRVPQVVPGCGEHVFFDQDHVFESSSRHRQFPDATPLFHDHLYYIWWMIF